MVHAKPKPLSPTAVTSHWPAFQGPTHDGKSPETHLLKHFDANGPTLLWEVETGTGYAAPAVVENRLVYFHRMGKEERVECVDAETGNHRWTFSYPSTYKDRYGFSNGPRSSPVISDHVVYTFGVEGYLHALDLHTGAVIWKIDTTQKYTVLKNHFGAGATPLIEGDLLIVHVGAPGGPCVIAYHKKTGKVAWQSGDQWTASYATPLVATVQGKRRLFVFAGGAGRPPTGGLLTIDPTDGRIQGRFPFRSERYESVNAASPIIIGHKVFITTAYRTGSVLLNVLPDGSLETSWKSNALQVEFATPIHHDGYIYGFDGGGKGKSALVSVNASTGEEVWRTQPVWEETVTRNGQEESMWFGIYRGSLVLADGHFLCLSEMGHLLWLDLSPNGYQEISRARLFTAHETFTGPVLSRGLLYVMQNKKDILTGKPPRLLCYDLRAETSR